MPAFSQVNLPEILDSCDHVSITQVDVAKVDRELKVSFCITPARKAVRSNYKMTLTPYLYNDNDTLALESVEIVGKQWARKEKQHRLLSGVQEKTSIRVIPKNEASSYEVYLPYDRKTMRSMSLRIEQTVEGCCNSTLLANQLLVEHAQMYTDPIPVIQKITRVPVLTKVNHKRQFSKDVLTVYFRVNRTEVDHLLFDNQNVLDTIIAVVNDIRNNREQVLRNIEITGFASPEGAYSQNQRLAINRAVALKNYIQKEIPDIADTCFLLNNGGENWEGIREMVTASDMKYRDEVLAVLNKTPVNKKELQALRGGQPYNYILKEFFPVLRNACYIAVYYDIFADEAADTINDALVLIDAKEYGNALDKLQTVKNDPRAYNAIGVCYMMIEQEQEAKIWLEKAGMNGSAEAIINLEQIN